MSKQLVTLGLLVVGSVGLSAPLAAQGRSAVSGAELNAAVAARPAGNRETVQRWLQTDRVTATAARMGVNTASLTTQVAALDDATLGSLAAQARADERQLAGGDSKIVISTTAVIIALLILILITD